MMGFKLSHQFYSLLKSLLFNFYIYILGIREKKSSRHDWNTSWTSSYIVSPCTRLQCHLVQSSSIPAPDCTPQTKLEKWILLQGNKILCCTWSRWSKKTWTTPYRFLKWSSTSPNPHMMTDSSFLNHSCQANGVLALAMQVCSRDLPITEGRV